MIKIEALDLETIKLIDEKMPDLLARCENGKIPLPEYDLLMTIACLRENLRVAEAKLSLASKVCTEADAYLNDDFLKYDDLANALAEWKHDALLKEIADETVSKPEDPQA